MATNSKAYNKANYKKYRWSKDAIKDRTARNAARKKAEKEWKVSKWDWKEVDHKKWVKAWNWKWNIRVISQKKNRQLWAKKANRKKKAKWPDLYYV